MTTRTNSSRAEISLPPGASPEWLELVRQQVESLKFGVVEIVVHDSQVTQIERTERVRLDKPRPGTGKRKSETINEGSDRTTGSSPEYATEEEP